MRSRSAVFAIALSAVVVAVASRPAGANGRLPASTSVKFQPGDDRKIVLGTTFGLLVSPDDAASWYWICEDNIGFSSLEDPSFVVTPTGTMLAGVHNGLSISRDSGCSWAFAGDPIAGAWIADAQLGSDGAIWLATANGQTPNDVFVSRDDGVSFTHADLPEHVSAWWKTIRVAPSDPERVYVSGYRIAVGSDAGSGTEALLYRRDPDGMWTKVTSPAPYEVHLLAVSPTDPLLVFAHLLGTTDALLRSPDGGVTWTQVLVPSMPLQALVVEADGRHIIAGAGSMTPGVRYVSDDAGLTWNPAPPIQMSCVGQRGDGTLFACGTNWDYDNFALARSTDGQAFTKILRFAELKGPLACPAGTKQVDVCEPLWPTLAEQFGIIPPRGQPDAGTVRPATGSGGCGCGVSPAVFVGLFGLRLRRRKAERHSPGA